MGCSTLYHLAKLGVSDAILIERNQLTSGTTWHSAAQVRALRSSQNLTNLIKYSIQLYSDLERETGQATGWIQKGSLSIATTPDRLIHVKRQEALSKLFGVSARSISKQETGDIWPMMNSDDVIGAVWSPDDGRVSPSDLCSALIKGAKSGGARVFENTSITGITTHAGRVVGLETTRGTIRTDVVALCTGLWSRAAGALAGVDIPVYPCEHFYLLTKPIDGIRGNVPTLSDHDSHLYIRDDSGGLLVGCFEPLGKPISPETLGDSFAFQLLPEDWDHFEPMMINALHRLPALEHAEVKVLLNGPESFTPDGSFILGEAAETQGLYLGCGMNSVGVASGGGAGMALAHCMVDGQLPMDLHEVDPKRFPGCWNNAAVLSQRAPEVLGKHYEITYPGQQWSSARNLRHLPLHSVWVSAKAHFSEVYGWERPLYFNKSVEPELRFNRPDWFEQVGKEVMYAHQEAALFDLSSFGKIRVTGPDAEAFLNRICANNLCRPPGHAIYTAMLNENGGMESDLTILRLGDEDYRLYVGSTAVKRDLAWLRRHLDADARVSLVDETEEYAVLGLMGPASGTIAGEIGIDELNELKYFRHGVFDIAGCSVLATRLSYVGEYGWELTCRASDAEGVYAALSAAGCHPAGVFAQTSMRIEKRFLAFGHDLDTESNPLEAGLGFAIDWDSDFIGRDALAKIAERESKTKLVSILLQDQQANPLGNEPIYANAELIGKTTSASYGYRIQKPVAIAQLNAQFCGTEVEVDIAGCRFSGQVLSSAAFDPKGLRMKRPV